MPRGPRIDAPGILHHVMARGIERREIFRSDGDREELLARLGAICADTGTVVYAWCLMTNHFHLAVRSTQPLAALADRRSRSAVDVGDPPRWGAVPTLEQSIP